MKRLLFAALIGCGPTATVSSNLKTTEAPVVGGSAESRFPAVGYLDSNGAAICGATLIDRYAAITAAHCVKGHTGTLGIGFGAVGSGPVYYARVVFVHGSYDGQGSPRYEHDVAVLGLVEPVDGITPARVQSPSEDQEALYVGYGRVTAGGSSNSSGYTHERKSAYQWVDRVGKLNVFVSGQDGGLCWGDSGGPLLNERTGNIYGVLADFDKVFDCQIGNAMIFTRLSAETTFIDRAVNCAQAADPAACVND